MKFRVVAERRHHLSVDVHFDPAAIQNGKISNAFQNWSRTGGKGSTEPVEIARSSPSETGIIMLMFLKKWVEHTNKQNAHTQLLSTRPTEAAGLWWRYTRPMLSSDSQPTTRSSIHQQLRSWRIEHWTVCLRHTWIGATENARPDIARPSKLRRLTSRDWTTGTILQGWTSRDLFHCAPKRWFHKQPT